jgi:hypothetical protein
MCPVTKIGRVLIWRDETMICDLLTEFFFPADELDSGGEANNSSTLTAPSNLTNFTNNQQNSSGFNDSVHRFDTLHFEISTS